jgi:hypothetical protein
MSAQEKERRVALPLDLLFEYVIHPDLDRDASAEDSDYGCGVADHWAIYGPVRNLPPPQISGCFDEGVYFSGNVRADTTTQRRQPGSKTVLRFSTAVPDAASVL